MRLNEFTIKHFRSIQDIRIIFPEKAPLVLLGPNNVGKSNILKAMDCLLGEKYTSYIDFQDSDYFCRDKKKYENISFKAVFDEYIKSPPYGTSTICFTTNHKFQDFKTKQPCIESTYHYESNEKMYISNDDREQCQFILIDATRDISRQLSYFSHYSILSRMSKKMHAALKTSAKTDLDTHFQNLKAAFEAIPEYKKFYDSLQSSFQSTVEGFEHKLEIDLSAYDPNNYFHSLRITAKDGKQVRSFEEFGTGEQQILLMSFIKAYAEVFKKGTTILGIEEPEAHLHPLAQKWLANNMKRMTQEGVQIIITTHSPEFLDIEGLEGFVKVYKENGITKVTQNTAKSLVEKCLTLKSNPQKTTEQTILPFYKANTFYDQLKGFFARKIILVEGPSEVFSLPNYFTIWGYDLIKNGVEIIDCRGKDQIARNYRLFKAYGYECYCLFDSDQGKGNEEISELFGFDPSSTDNQLSTFKSSTDNTHGYFGKDFESYMKSNFDDYSLEESQTDGSKPLKAKILSEKNKYKPTFINDIAKALKLQEVNSPHQEEDLPF